MFRTFPVYFALRTVCRTQFSINGSDGRCRQLEKRLECGEAGNSSVAKGKTRAVKVIDPFFNRRMFFSPLKRG
jgi:hypothetical protein